LDVPCEAQQGEPADHPVTEVHLPPPQAVPRRRREGVMRVMPPLPEGKDAEHEVIPALIVAPVRPLAPQVANRVDAPRHVVDEEDAGQPTPYYAPPGPGPGPRQ